MADDFSSVAAQNSAGTAVADDSNKNLVVELNDRLATVERRLAEINSYQEKPPAIVEEKASLERRRDILLATKNRLSANTASPSKPTQATPFPVANNDALKVPKPIEPLPKPFETPKFDQSPKPAVPLDRIDSPPVDRWRPPASTANKTSEKPKPEENKNSLIGQDYAVESEEEDGVDERPNVLEYKTPKEEEKISAGELEFDDEQIARKLDKTTSVKILDKTSQGIDIFEELLKANSDHPDRDYLEKVCQKLKTAVDNLDRRTKEVKMSEGQLKQAIIGRVTGYFDSAKVEFELSGLLGKDTEHKLQELFDGLK